MLFYMDARELAFKEKQKRGDTVCGYVRGDLPSKVNHEGKGQYAWHTPRSRVPRWNKQGEE